MTRTVQAQLGAPVAPPTLESTVGSGWQYRAACKVGADPEVFAPLELHGPDEMAVVEAAAHRWCAGCPVLTLCGAFADEHRYTGLYGGVYRRVQRGAYVWQVLVDGAPEPSLADRRVGARGAA